jgi:putative lipoprotein
MPPDIGIRTQALVRGALSALFSVIATAAMAQSIQGTATYKERMALPAGAVFEATIEDVSRADAPAVVIARTRVASPGNPPIEFAIAYDRARILADHQYVVRAKILLEDKLLFASDTAAPVITRGSPTSVSLMLRRVPSAPSSARPLETTYWKAVELAGKPAPQQQPIREAHLVFQAEGRVSGSDGCNRIIGTYELKGEAITLGQMAGTHMACADTTDIEQEFRAALKGASRWKIAGDRLELIDAAGVTLAAFEARAETPR